MALSPKQLRLVFAKLRAKGLLNYIPAARKARAPIYQYGKETNLFPTDRVNKLLDRIPQSHQNISRVRGLYFGDRSALNRWALKRLAVLDPTAQFGGIYHKFTRELFVVDDASLYSSPRMGYGKLPSWVKTGKSVSKNQRVGSANALYHEYAHSIDGWGDYAKTSEWKNIAAKSWGKLSIFSPQGPGSPPPVTESWAEAYSMFARSKPSQQRLKREAPEVYEYMRKFFESPEKVRRTFSAEHRTGMQVAAVGGLGTYGAYKLHERLKRKKK